MRKPALCASPEARVKSRSLQSQRSWAPRRCWEDEKKPHLPKTGCILHLGGRSAIPGPAKAKRGSVFSPGMRPSCRPAAREALPGLPYRVASARKSKKRHPAKTPGVGWRTLSVFLREARFRAALRPSRSAGILDAPIPPGTFHVTLKCPRQRKTTPADLRRSPEMSAANAKPVPSGTTDSSPATFPRARCTR